MEVYLCCSPRLKQTTYKVESKAADQNCRFGAAGVEHFPALMLLAVHVLVDVPLLDGIISGKMYEYHSTPYIPSVPTEGRHP